MTAALGVGILVTAVLAIVGWARAISLSSALAAEKAARDSDGRRLVVLEKDLRSSLEVELAARKAAVDAEIARRRKEFYIDAGNGAIVKWLKVHHPMTIDEAITQVRDPEIRASLGDYWGSKGYLGGEPVKMKVPLPR